MFMKLPMLCAPIVSLVLITGPVSSAIASPLPAPVLDTVAKAEKSIGGRIGIALLDNESGTSWTHRGDERFAMNSTFKSFACGALLAKVDRQEAKLETAVAIKAEDILSWAPVSEEHVGGTLTQGELCAAAITMSDNTAANKILEAIGGPSGLTAFMRSIGDNVTRLDRTEPDLNVTGPGEERDTTSPTAALASLKKLLHGDVLTDTSQAQLNKWMEDGKVTGNLIRKTLPKGWKVADKSGSGSLGSRGIIAMLTPPERKPIYMVIYLSKSQTDATTRDALIADLSDAMLKALSAQ
nr:class A beta-lactamase [uncultured Cohaesibacter sp.]